MLLPMTPGQRDILDGTYSTEFVNGNAMLFAVRAPEELTEGVVAAAAEAMWRQHPVLRMLPERTTSGWYQRMLDVDQWEPGAHVVSAWSASDTLPTAMDHHVTSMTDRFDVMRRPSWGIVHLRSEAGDHVVFVLNHLVADLVAVSHFVRTFVTAVTGHDDRPNPKDTYLDHLRSLQARWEAEPTAAGTWWSDRPWADVPLLPGVDEMGPERAHAEVVDVLAEAELADPRLTETQVIRAVERSVRDVTGAAITRIDAARVARDAHTERFASGWLSHALPIVTDADVPEVTASLDRERASAWLTAYDGVRRRTDLTTEHQLRAQVFVNFFGSFAPHRWSLNGFRMSPVQPTLSLPRRSSLTPIHLKVRRGDGVWTLSWTLSARYRDSDVLTEIRSLTSRLLVAA